MTEYKAEERALIPAPPDRVYAVLADYDDHPRILPPDYFKKVDVIAGGRGTGTVVDIQMEVLGARQRYRMALTEVEPGRVLLEADEAAGVATTFTIDPGPAADQCWLTISTRGKTSPSLRGLVEKWLTPVMLRRIYRQELALIAAYVREQ